MLVDTIIASKVSKPLHTKESEVVSYICLEDMIGLMCSILEVTVVGIKTCIKPIVGDSDIQSTNGICHSKVELLCIFRFGQSHRAPCIQAKSLVAHTQRWL